MFDAPTIWEGGAAGLAVTIAAATALWLASVRRRDASIADIGWGPGFALLAWWYVWLFAATAARPRLLAILVTIWGARLALHLFRRHDGEDPRYGAMREGRGDGFWWTSLFTVFWLQAGILWFVALPLLVTAWGAGPEAVTATDAIGLVCFTLGFAFETIGDYQLTRFKADPANRGRILQTGLWRYTRHPNYFGDALLWWGLFLIAASTPYGWVTILSPAAMTLLLLKVSGVALLERGLRSSKPGYADYAARTSAFVPWPPRR